MNIVERRYDGMVEFWLKLGTNYASMEKKENSVDEQMIDQERNYKTFGGVNMKYERLLGSHRENFCRVSYESF